MLFVLRWHTENMEAKLKVIDNGSENTHALYVLNSKYDLCYFPSNIEFNLDESLVS